MTTEVAAKDRVLWITNLHIPPNTIGLEDCVLREGERSDNIYVVVDSSMISRCEWCGVMESESRRFCSTECAFAAAAPGMILILIVGAVLSSLLILNVGQPTYMSTPGNLKLLTLVLLIPVVIMVIQGMEHRKSVPRNSRRNEAPLDTALLRTVSTSVACPRCDANMDVRGVGEDGVYVCGYCGATGTVAVIDKSEQRRSGSGGSI